MRPYSSPAPLIPPDLQARSQGGGMEGLVVLNVVFLCDNCTDLLLFTLVKRQLDDAQLVIDAQHDS